ncbi:preprotein translocase subunit SecE [Fructilactobacillus carniphilus]|uniref:Protein translocase subunit SecE n=1 Tax=Fructilactobacillus carniphilus TaxID=2940297 RepID=A0ABY5BUD1_9LACO|nr:preprotein translocase subunit SecE [Fructilactobacillus carniphilus]USS90109.1 preprotein translocase subunit SecE [Fructilactobacillus carniphilus]
MKRFWNFLKSVIGELKLITWPNARQTRIDTTTVIGTTLFFTVFLGLIDWALEALLLNAG